MTGTADNVGHDPVGQHAGIGPAVFSPAVFACCFLLVFLVCRPGFAADAATTKANKAIHADKLRYNDKLKTRDVLRYNDKLKPQHKEQIRSGDKLKPEHVERIRAERDKLNFKNGVRSGRKQ